MSEPKPPSRQLDVGAGLGMTVAFNGLAIVILLACIGIPDIGLYFVSSITVLGLVQLVYMIPAILIARWKGQPNVAKGLIIGAAVTFLLNAACWALFALPSFQS